LTKIILLGLLIFLHIHCCWCWFYLHCLQFKKNYEHYRFAYAHSVIFYY